MWGNAITREPGCTQKEREPVMFNKYHQCPLQSTLLGSPNVWFILLSAEKYVHLQYRWENFQIPCSHGIKLWALYGGFYNGVICKNVCHIQAGLLFIWRTIHEKCKLSISSTTNMKCWNRNKIMAINTRIQKGEKWETHTRHSLIYSPYPGVGGYFLIRPKFFPWKRFSNSGFSMALRSDFCPLYFLAIFK